jgi:hypothetical protein
MKRKLSKVQIAVIALFTFVCACISAFLCRSILRSGSYTFDPAIYASELKQADGAVILDGDMDDGSGRYHTTRFSLPKGNFTIDIEYEAEHDYNVLVTLDNGVDVQVPLAAGGGVSTQIFSLEWPTDRAYFNLEVPEEGTVQIKRITVSSARPLYTDGFFQLLILIIIYFTFLYHAVRFADYDKGKKVALFVLTGLIILINIPMYVNVVLDDPLRWRAFDPIAPMTRFGIDTRGHLLRLEGVLYGILDGQYPVIISPNLLNECGELSFLNPDFFLYPFAMIRIFGGSMLLAYRLISITVNICVVLVAYYSFRLVSDDIKLNLILTIVYSLEPHRLRVVLEKGAAIGMGLPYIFLPLCIAGIYLILKREKKGMFITAFGVSGILESHVTTLILLFILLGILVIVFLRELLSDGMKSLRLAVGSMIIALVMNIGMIVIFLFYFRSGLNTDALVWDNWTEYLLNGAGLFTDVESRFYLICIPIAILIAVVYRRKDVDYKFGITLIAFAGILFWMTSSYFPWDILRGNISVFRTFTDYMQKPHRFYTVMDTSLVMGILIILKNKRPGKKLAAVMLICTGVTLIFGLKIKYADYLNETPLLYDQIIGDMNTRQFYNYLPEGVDKNTEFSGTASLSDMEAVESISYSKRGTHADYTYFTDADGVFAEFPLLTYAGYRAYDESGQSLEVIKGDGGRLTVYLNGDGVQHEMHVRFVVHPVFKVIYILSLATAVVIILFYIRKYILIQENPNADDQNT